MTLADARDRALCALEAALKEAPPPPLFPPARVTPIDGAMTGKEIQRQQLQIPSVQVAVMGRSDAGIRVVAYVVTDTRTPAVGTSALELLDTVEEALRTLPDATYRRDPDAQPPCERLPLPRDPGRALLEVRTQALFDPDTMAAGGVALWAVTAAWPDLAAVDDPSAVAGGLLAAANELLAPAIDAALGLANIDEQDAAAVAARQRRRGMTEQDRGRLALEGPLPYAEVRHGGAPPGEVRARWDGAVERRGSGSGRTRWPAGEAGRPLGPAPAPAAEQTRQAVRGVRTWTATITLWAGTAYQVDAALTELLRVLPQRWTWSGQQNLVTVGRLDGPAYTNGAFRAGVEVTLAAAALAGEPETIRTISGAVSVRPGDADSQDGHRAPLNRARYVRPGGVSNG